MPSVESEYGIGLVVSLEDIHGVLCVLNYKAFYSNALHLLFPWCWQS